MLSNFLKATPIFFLVILLCSTLQAQKHYERYEAIDIQHYTFNITLNDENDRIEVVSNVKVRFKKSINTFSLDLVKTTSAGKGMKVNAIEEGGSSISFKHNGDQLELAIEETQVGSFREYTIKYTGVPADGLIISENKYGERTFFGDNWPDRAKNWLPVVDHPSDKATVEWAITAPAHYQTIGNGKKVEETNLSKTMTLSRWITDDPIPTKVMVMGAARFAVEEQGDINDIPISSWVYPQDRDNGFHDYAYATPIMDYFISHVGPYPFRKLANIQSKTRFGGMENAGNIFYSESSVTGTGSSEALIAHEVAHQWFGNSASELNWHHIWLSEGFATYFTNLYVEHKYGRDDFVEREKTQRQEIIDYAKNELVPVVNPKIEDYMQLLNPNSYQKGGWVLHMLRKKIGDDSFWKGIRAYYKKYQYSNALSEDLQQVMEEASGQNLTTFFNQWLMQAGQPDLQVQWSESPGSLSLDVRQLQKQYIFSFPLEVQVVFKDGTEKIHTLEITKDNEKFQVPIRKSIDQIILDPNVWLLFELSKLKQK